MAQRERRDLGLNRTLNEIQRGAARASREFRSATTFVDELRLEQVEERIRASRPALPSTSVVPVRCPGCAEWSLGACRYCE